MAMAFGMMCKNGSAYLVSAAEPRSFTKGLVGSRVRRASYLVMYARNLEQSSGTSL